MRYSITLSLFILMAACREHDPRRAKIQTEVTKIVTQDISTTGMIVEPVQVGNLKIEKISMQEYYQHELKEQDSQFKDFLDKINKLKTRIDVSGNQATHDSVMSYLYDAIKSASTTPEIYKVDYDLKATTLTAKYNRRQVMFLDSSYKKLETDYNFLKKR